MKKKKNPVTWINDLIFNIEKEVTWVLFLAMLILLVVQVACRYALHMPLAWSEEIARYAYIYVSFLGAAIAVRERSHISINIMPALVNALDKHNEHVTNIVLYICDILMSIICIAFWAWMTMQLYVYTMDVKNLGTLTPALMQPIWIVYMGPTVGAGLMTIHYTLNFLEMLITRETLKPVEDQDLVEAFDEENEGKGAEA